MVGNNRLRAGIFVTIFALIICFFGLKLYDLQLVDSEKRKDNVKTFTTVTRVKAARGDILDRNGNVLVTNRASYDLVFNHYVILSAEDTNQRLLQLVQVCRAQEIEYFDHLPVSEEAPFSYTVDSYNSTWQGYFQAYLTNKGNLDSDISAPLLIKKLRDLYKIPRSGRITMPVPSSACATSWICETASPICPTSFSWRMLPAKSWRLFWS